MDSSKRPAVSVVIPVYNREKCVGMAIESVLSQDVEDVEVVCVDDASTDTSGKVLAAYAAKDPRVRVVTLEKNGGTGVARKTGILAARGEYILCLDADDRFLPGVFGRLLAVMRRKGVDVLQFRCKVVPVGGFSPRVAGGFRHLLDCRLPSHRPGDWRLLRDQARSASLRFPAVWNKLYRAAPLQEAAHLIENTWMVISEDMLVLLILQSALPSWGSTRLRCVEYRVGEGSISTGETAEKIFESKLNRAVSCHALKRYVDAESERLIPGLHDEGGDAAFAAAPQPTQRRVLWLNKLCSALVMDRMEITWPLIPKDADGDVLEIYQRKFLDAFGSEFCQKFFSREVASLHIRETPTFRLGSLLLWPARMALGILGKLRRQEKQVTGNTAALKSPASSRIAIVTFHTAANYGAALQTYALDPDPCANSNPL